MRRTTERGRKRPAKAKETLSDEARAAVNAIAASYDLLAADARKREALKPKSPN